jgi:NAD(P)H-dependent flavin oxidoreductase YrpB (nitropropane dioxygenase family)
MLHTRLCDLLGIDVPIILAGMGAGATSAKLAAEV